MAGIARASLSAAYLRREQRQRQIGCALAAQDREVDLDVLQPAGLGEHAGLRLDRLRREDATTRCHRRVGGGYWRYPNQWATHVDQRAGTTVRLRVSRLASNRSSRRRLRAL